MGKQICENCENKVDELFETVENIMICSECIEDEDYKLCDECGLWSQDYVEAPSGSVYCEECLANVIPLEDYVGDCRFLMDTVNFETLQLDEDLEEELREKLKDLAVRALFDGDQCALKTMESLIEPDSDEISPDDSLEDRIDSFVEACLKDRLITKAFEAFNYVVTKETIYHGPHGHGSFGVIYIK